MSKKLPDPEFTDEEVRYRLSKARTFLLLSHPFFASLLLGMTPLRRDEYRTMATDGHYLYYNGAFVMGLDMDELIGVLAHEAMHPAMCHHLRRQGRHPGKWNIACFGGATPVLMADGSSKQIARIQEGDKVWSPMGPSTVLANLKRGVQPVGQIGEYGIVVTGDHKFLTSEGGFISADTYNPRMHGYVLGTSGSGRVYSETLQRNVYSRSRDSNWSGIPQCRSVPRAPWVDGRQVHKTTARDTDCLEFAQHRLGLHSRLDRRGGDSPDSGRQEIRPAVRGCGEHLTLPETMDGDSRVQPQHFHQLVRQRVLEDSLDRLQLGQVSPPGTTVSGDQGEAFGSALRVHLYTAWPAKAAAADGSYAANCLDDQVAERAKFIYTATERAELVYDLVTEHHVFSAGGLITHNCDYAINPIILDSKLKLPKDALINRNYKGLMAEEIYNLLPQQKQQAKGDDSDKDNYDGDPGGCGGVLDATNQNGEAPSKAQREQMEAEAKVRLSQAAAAAKARGKLPAGIEALVEEMLAPQVIWQDLLRNFVAKVMVTDTTWRNPSRRFAHMGLIFPGPLKDGCGEIVVGVDTSGSIYCDPEILMQFLGEINSILEDVKPERVHVVYCDAKVQHAQVFEMGDTISPATFKVRGGGGTAFEPVFDWAKDNAQPQCLIYLTDLMGSFPSGFSAPTIWICANNEGANAPFGEVIHVNTKKNRGK